MLIFFFCSVICFYGPGLSAILLFPVFRNGHVLTKFRILWIAGRICAVVPRMTFAGVRVEDLHLLLDLIVSKAWNMALS